MSQAVQVQGPENLFSMEKNVGLTMSCCQLKFVQPWALEQA